MHAHAPIRAILVLLALAVLGAAVVAVSHDRGALHLGMLVESNSGRVIAVDGGSVAAAAGLHTGDTVTAIGGLALDREPVTIDGLLPVSVKQGAIIAVHWVAAPGTGRFWAGDLLLIVAAAFWAAGLLGALLGPRSAASYWFSCFALSLALALAGCLGAAQPDPSMLWLPAPAAFAAMAAYVWLQRALAEEPQGASTATTLPLTLSAQALVLVLAIEFGPRLFGADSGPFIATAAALDLLAMLVAAHYATLRAAAMARSAPARRRLRLALLLGFVAWLPAVVLGLLPMIGGLLGITGTLVISQYFGAISLAVLAVTYPAIVARGDLFMLDRAVRRLAASLVVTALLLAIALGALHAIDAAAAPGANDRLSVVLALVLLAAPAFEPIRRRLQGAIEHRLDAREPGYGSGLEAIGDRLLQALDEPGIASILTGYAPAVLGVTSIAVWLRATDRRWLYFAPSANGHHAVPREEAGTLALLDGGAALTLAPAEPPPMLRTDAPFAPARDGGDGVALYVPVCIGEEPRGLLLLGARRSQDPYRMPEREALILLARQVAAALLFVDQIAELRRRNAELAQLTSRLARAREEERKHLSHELHDAVAQDLVAITRQMHRHQSRPVSEAIWADMIAQAQEALTAIRRICNDLRPAILDMGLGSALRELVDRATSGRQPLVVRLEIRGAEQRLDEEREFALYRICQEALANVVKHAGATEALITARFETGTASVEVVDNGTGFAVPERLEDIGGDHLGLLGMRERLADLGGEVRVESRPGQGTRVWASVSSAT